LHYETFREQLDNNVIAKLSCILMNPSILIFTWAHPLLQVYQ